MPNFNFGLRWGFPLGIVLRLASATFADDLPLLVDRIDGQLASVWKQAGIPAAEPTRDAQFLRRVSLDLIGRIPTTFEVREFLADESPDKRSHCIDRLINAPEYALHWGTVWRHEFLPESDTPAFRNLARPFEDWLRAQLRKNASYQSLVHEIMTVSLNHEGASAATAFIAAGELKPANLAANSSRTFLGINLDCAQCHDHPFARWSRRQFWEFAAFFTAPKTTTGDAFGLEIQIPETLEVVLAKWLTDEPVELPQSLDREIGRQVLATWMVSPQNPYFTRNAVNRVWSRLMGQGLIEPVDDLSDLNPPAVPAVLEILASDFSSSGFDLKRLIATITRLQAYQQTNAFTSDTSDRTGEPWMFQAMPVRGLSGEQMYASLLTAAGMTDADKSTSTYYGSSDRERFVASFTTDRPSRSQRSVLQALELMNGSLTGELLNGKTLAAICEAPFLSPRQKLETLFLATLSRRPEPEELLEFEQTLPSLERGEKQALKAVFWVLINSAEFGVNH